MVQKKWGVGICILQRTNNGDDTYHGHSGKCADVTYTDFMNWELKRKMLPSLAHIVCLCELKGAKLGR